MNTSINSDIFLYYSIGYSVFKGGPTKVTIIKESRIPSAIITANYSKRT